MTVRVVIVDDQPLVRSGLRIILDGEDDIEVVGEAGDGAAAVPLIRERHPDVVLLDVQMPGADGLEAMQQISDAELPTRVLMLTTFDLEEYVYRAMRNGAAGFLLKDMEAEDIVAAVRQAARGLDALLAPAVTRRLIDRFASVPLRPTAARLDRLTTRETDVLRLVGCGLSNTEIAAELYIGETTVKTHLGRVMTKLGLRDRVQAAIFAHENRLV